jgi:hypothetical protein
VNPIYPSDFLTVNNIAGWNGAWFALGGGTNVGVNSRVFDIKTSGGNVYAGGGFITAGGIPANYIAKWNGTNWSALGSGLNYWVDAIAVSGDEVYVTGPFTMAGGKAAHTIAKWNGTSWSALGSGLNHHWGGGIGSLEVIGREVYVGGLFSMAGEVSASNIAKWNSLTSTWSALGSGVDSYAFAIAAGVDGVYVGGGFITAGRKPSNYFGLWHTTILPTGSFSGRVTDPAGNPVPGARIQVCRSPAGAPCFWRGATNAQGDYTATGLPDGEYLVTASPPRSACLLPATIGPLTITNGSVLAGQNIQFSAAQGLPPGTTISPSRGQCFPFVDWSTPLQLTTQGCPGGSASYQIVQGSSVVRSGPMTEVSPGQYRATIAPLRPLHSYATVQITIQCPNGPPQVITFTIYIDPSGHVRTVSGAPIEGATVTLFYFDDGIGDFAVVPDGEAIMSPANRTNPDLTEANGHFGWDVIAGYYKVRAQKAGCVSPTNSAQSYVESDMLVIPPPITDLDLRLDCRGNGENTIYLPLIVR